MSTGPRKGCLPAQEFQDQIVKSTLAQTKSLFGGFGLRVACLGTLLRIMRAVEEFCPGVEGFCPGQGRGLVRQDDKWKTTCRLPSS